MLKQQKRLKFDCLQTTTLQGNKFAFLLPFAFFICQNNKTSGKGFVFMFSRNVRQKVWSSGFDFLTCLVERIYLCGFDYLTGVVQMTRSHVQWPNRRYNKPTRRPV